MSIIIPNGGHIINDATAVESTVKSGNVFYNNTGRHVGTATIDEYKIYTVNITSLPYNTGSYSKDDTNFYYINKSLGMLTYFEVESSSSIRGHYDSISLPKIKRLTGFEYSGKRYNISQSDPMMICTELPYNGGLPTPLMYIDPGIIEGDTKSGNAVLLVYKKGTYKFYYI